MILASLKDDFQKTCRTFAVSFNTWIPFLGERQIWDLAAQLTNYPPAESCALLLGIYLIAHKSRKVDTMECIRSIYPVLKTLHSRLMSSSSPTIEIIQAGLLIAVYEHGQQLGQESYMTIGACSRMGYSIGLQKTLQINPPCDPTAKAIFETQNQTWWCVIMMERYVAH
jgi:hypothetical protein